ncbi:hypothetical protein [Austwickia chelonae]|uniref:hypothetical protein n=1 Tax=Austwickia chelonae TaxID=100225 RepID=UPI000E266D29|nr:hypothetical protein [Austwickia chelonae]
MESKNTLSDLRDLFPPADSDWVDRAVFTLIRAGVTRTYVETALIDAAIACDGEGRRAADLHGPADDWAAATVADWRDEGTPVWAVEATLDLRTMLVGAFWLAATLALFFGLFDRFDDQAIEVTVGYALLPTLVALGCTAGYGTYERALRRFSRPVAAACACAVAGVAVALAVVLIAVTRGHVLGLNGFLLHLCQVVGNAGVAMLLAAVLPREWRREKQSPRGTDISGMDDEEWLAVFGQELRRSTMYSESRVRARCAEARAHAVATGRTLVTEFGAPTDYAAGLPRDTEAEFKGRVRSRALLLLFWIGMGVYSFLCSDRSDLIAVGLIGISLLLFLDLARQIWRNRRAKEERATAKRW